MRRQVMNEAENRDTFGAKLRRDTAASILLGVALFLTVLNFAAAMVIARRGIAYIGLMEGALVLTGLFAVVGAAFGLVRGLRTAKRRRA